MLCRDPGACWHQKKKKKIGEEGRKDGLGHPPLGTRAGHLPVNAENNPRPGAPPKARAFLPAQEGPACLPSRAPPEGVHPGGQLRQPPRSLPGMLPRRGGGGPRATLVRAARPVKAPAIRGPGWVGGGDSPRAPLRVRRRPRAHRVPRRPPRTKSPGAPSRTRQRVGNCRARRRGCPPRPGPSERPRHLPRAGLPTWSQAHAGLGGARGRSCSLTPRDTKAAPRPGSPPHPPAAHGAPQAFENHRTPAPARASQPRPPGAARRTLRRRHVLPARRRLVPAVRSLHPTWGLEQPAPPPRLRLDPSAGASGDCAAPGSLEARAHGPAAARRQKISPAPAPPPPPRAAPA